ncbi:hypothetical protein L1987_33268 [Smallanthus sonchifolius]|uniref:Uncharacterized protein n=1 Tax=Smallanthus sonchifolius TaxID=185202 RepID=A0ACB9HQW7_9ASTR|nr:hypothetical protein L1987_33268 [Smallanthus sonchifolius]
MEEEAQLDDDEERGRRRERSRGANKIDFYIINIAPIREKMKNERYSPSYYPSSVEWIYPTDPRIYKARVTAIADSPDSVFSAFDSNHKENCIIPIDKSTLQVTSEIGLQSGNSSKSIVPGNLTYVNDLGLLAATAVTSGACNFIKLSNN